MRNPKPIRNEPEMAELIRTAERLFREPFPSTFACKGGEEARYLYSQIEGMPTSTHGDAALIVWHFLYHTGRAPEAIHPSRGNSLRVLHHGSEYACRVSKPYDHRNGVTGGPIGEPSWQSAFCCRWA